MEKELAKLAEAQGDFDPLEAALTMFQFIPAQYIVNVIDALATETV